MSYKDDEEITELRGLLDRCTATLVSLYENANPKDAEDDDIVECGMTGKELKDLKALLGELGR